MVDQRLLSDFFEGAAFEDDLSLQSEIGVGEGALGACPDCPFWHFFRTPFDRFVSYRDS